MRETLVVINLQAKVAPSHIGANYLLRSMRGEGSNKLSESKKQKQKQTNNTKDRPFINRCQHNQQLPFQKQNKQ